MNDEYRGIFKTIIEDPFLNISEVKFYEGLFVDFYINLLADAVFEAELYIKQGLTTGRKVLEIACGTGRIGIPLARAGFDVTGVDISEDMLSGYKKNLEKEKAKVKRKIQLFRADITKFETDEKYDLIILPATTICLFNDEQIQQIFKFSEDHLAHNGRFVFDRNDLKDHYYNKNASEIKSYIWDDDAGHHISIYQEFLEENQKESIVNIYCCNINGDEVSRNIGYTRKRIITEEIVLSHISNSNLKLHRNIFDFQNESGKFYILEKK